MQALCLFLKFKIYIFGEIYAIIIDVFKVLNVGRSGENEIRD